jgi:hypothetical protein
LTDTHESEELGPGAGSQIVDRSTKGSYRPVIRREEIKATRAYSVPLALGRVGLPDSFFGNTV